MRSEKEILGLFQKELQTFEDNGSHIREFTLYVLQEFPDYFFQPQTSGVESGIILHTKSAMEYVNTLFKLEYFQEKFIMTNRDIIRSAVMLHDGFQFGIQYSNRVVPEHPKISADFIMDSKWDTFLPIFVRSAISGIVETHSGQWMDGILRPPSNDMEHFAHACIFLASKRSTTIDLPYNLAYYQNKINEQINQQINQFPQKDVFLHVAKQMVTGRNWDGRIYYEGQIPYIYVDQQKIPVARELEQAFVILGQAYQGQNNFV